MLKELKIKVYLKKRKLKAKPAVMATKEVAEEQAKLLLTLH